MLPMCLSNFKAIRQFKVPISWLRDFTRSYEKTSFRILRQGPGSVNNSTRTTPNDGRKMLLKDVHSENTRLYLISDYDITLLNVGSHKSNLEIKLPGAKELTVTHLGC